MTTWFTGISRYQRTLRRNAFLWCFIFLLAFVALMGRLFWLQVVKHAHYSELGERYRFREIVLPAQRGRLLDRNYAVLALDDQRLSLYADPTLCIYPWEESDSGRATAFVAAQLAPVLGRTEQELLSDLRRQVSFVWVKRNLSPEAASQLRASAYPGLEVRADGFCYRIGVDHARVPVHTEIAPALADALNLPVEEVRAQLGLPAPGDATGDEPAARPTGQRWIGGLYDADQKDAVDQLHLPGVIFRQARRNYSLGVDPRPYLHQAPGYHADATAKALAPILDSTPSAIRRRLEFRPRFTWLKRGLPEETYQQVQRLMGTFFVVEPGRVLVPQERNQTPQEALDEAVERLHDMLNEKDTPEVISREEIRRTLLPDGPPGVRVLGERLVNGGPSLSVARRLLARQIPGVVYGLPGVAMQHERRRFYPYGKLASPTLGFVTFDHGKMQGAFGLEQTQNRTLMGVDGYESKEIDARRRTIPERRWAKDPVDGRDVVLTLDRDIQLAAEEALAKMVDSTRAAGGQCIVMDPETGEILALAALPSWDANAPGRSAVPLVNPAISHFYEPGSTFKTLTVMAALEEGVTRDRQQITYCSGALGVGRRTIHEAHNAHGAVDAGRLLEQSCNIGSAQLAMRLGPERFMKWCERLGFGARTGIELRNESPGSLNRTNVTAKITLANMGFGQSLAVTPLQMLAMYSTVANGGYLVRPHLVKAHLRADGTREEAAPERTRVCSPETARLLRGYLERVVTDGTGGNAAIPGYSVAGKTGTAQKAGEHGYSSGLAIGSFIGFTPVQQPRLAIIAVIDEPKGSRYGGVVAAPVFTEVGRRALHYLNVPPDNKATPSASPAR